ERCKWVHSPDMFEEAAEVLAGDRTLKLVPAYRFQSEMGFNREELARSFAHASAETRRFASVPCRGVEFPYGTARWSGHLRGRCNFTSARNGLSRVSNASCTISREKRARDLMDQSSGMCSRIHHDRRRTRSLR